MSCSRKMTEHVPRSTRAPRECTPATQLTTNPPIEYTNTPFRFFVGLLGNPNLVNLQSQTRVDGYTNGNL
jgi:hypothetical protein